MGAVASAISPGSDRDDEAINLDGTRDDLPPPSARKSTGKTKGGAARR
jgi:hypothetical protein